MVFDSIEIVNRVEELGERQLSGRFSAYVIIDVCYFSSTVIQLLEEGVSAVVVSEERGDEFSIRDSTSEEVVIGGPTGENYQTVKGYDFFNSPASVEKLSRKKDLDGVTATLTSSNGGRAVNKILSRTEGELYIGAMMNAHSLGSVLKESDYTVDDVCFVSCGSDGVPAAEDYLGGVHIASEWTGFELGDKHWKRHPEIVRNSHGLFDELPEHRVRDFELLSDVGSGPVPFSDSSNTFCEFTDKCK